ncbi:MAG TPA: glycosyltransferase family 9 protein [Woeseiaceae bacterium]|nr:glycosyltransferase family 9 protein [Woeseiaceae bacterium]
MIDLIQLFSNAPPQDICLVRLSAIGDACHVLAVVRNINDNWPNARVTWIIGKTEAALLGDIAGVEFIIFDKSKGRAAYRDIKQALAGRHFDVALCMHPSMRANRIYRLIPTRIRLGFDYRRAKDWQWLFTNRRIAARQRQHILDGMMEFARAIGSGPTPLRWDIPTRQDDREFAQKYASTRCLVISPCSSVRRRNFRNWPVERLVAVAQHAQDRHACRIIITGSNSALEHEYADRIAAESGADLVNLVGQTTLKQSFALFAAADLVLCPDSGPAHMATAAGTPVIGLYASTNPDRAGPYVSRALTVNRYPDAVEKYLGKRVEQVRWGERVRHPEVMSLISVADVTAKVDSFFQTGAEA